MLASLLLIWTETVKRNSSPKPRNAWGAELTAAFALKDKAEVLLGDKTWYLKQKQQQQKT